MQKKEEITILHRFFENEYPAIDQMVVVVVNKVEDYASYVKLLEYSGKEGMIAPSELTRSKRKGHFKALKVGRVEVMRVLQIDKVRGFIDLSKKSVNANEEKAAKDHYAKVRLVNSMLVGVSEAIKVDITMLYEKLIWPLHKKGINPIDFFKNNQDELDNLKQLPAQVIDRLKLEIERRLKPVASKIVSIIDVSVDHFRGIELIKEALQEGENHKVGDLSVRYTIKGSPLYAASIQTIHEKAGKEVMREANEKVGAIISKYGGSFKVKEEPKVLGNKKEEESKIDEEEEEDQDQDEDDDSGMGSGQDD